MQNNKMVSSNYIGIVVYFLTRSLFIGFGTTNIISIAKNDSWMSAILGTIFGIFLILFIINLSTKKQSESITLKGAIPLFIISAAVLFISYFAISKILAFTDIKYLDATPAIVIGALFLFIALFGVYKGLETIFRSIEIMFIISITLFIVSIFLLIPHVELSNLKPLFINGVMPVLKGGIMYAFYSVLPTYLLISFPNKNILNKKNYRKNVLIGYIVGNITTIISILLIISILGYKLANLYIFPAYFVLKKVELFATFSNIENFIATQWLYDLFILLGISCVFLQETVKKFIKNRKFCFGVTSLICVIILFLACKYKVNLTIVSSFTKSWTFILCVVLLIVTTYVYKILEKNN